MRCSGVDEDLIACARVEIRAARIDNFNVAEVLKILSGTLGQLLVNFDANYMTLRADNFGEDGRLIADPAADM